ncbi:beta-glucosidase BoGH3B-like protein [Tanacetum coccineum]
MGDTMINVVYKNANAPIEARIKDLMSRMSVKEKLGQMTQIERAVATPDVIRDLCIGSVLSGGGSKPFDKATSADWADMVDGLQKGALESRLGIPMFYGSDAVHGNNNVYGTTIFPHNVGLGATRDPDLVERIGAATALETRASGVQYAFAPCVAVCRDPRWGRCYEGYSEDTELVRKMTSLVTGLQGTPPPDHPSGYPYVAGRNNVMACAKHFVGDGGTDKGKNEGNTIISFEELENIHMLPYPDCISKGVCTVMASYSSWNGTKMHSHRHLLTDSKRKGIVISDWEALDRFYDPHGLNYRSVVLSAVNAGGYMVMVPFRCQLFLEDLGYLVESEEVPLSRIDDDVERILRVKFAAGLFEYPMADRSLLDIVGCKMILVISVEVGPPLGMEPVAKLPPVSEAIGENTEVVYEENPTIDSLSAQDFSYAIVVVGEAPYVESGGDNSELTIPFNGNELLKLVADKIPTLGILISGRPLVLEPSVLETLDALVAAWLPGTEGNGITDVIFGDYEFHGRLPVSWFKTVDQLPMNTHQDSYDPLFPLGYGLKSKA